MEIQKVNIAGNDNYYNNYLCRKIRDLNKN